MSQPAEIRPVRQDRAATAGRFTIPSVLDAWALEGPLVHVQTGFARLDALTGGGPVFGTRWYLLGAPDAGKTAVLVQMLDEFLFRGLTVGLLAVDEDPGDVATRFLQRRKFKREECETREEGVLLEMMDVTPDLEGLVIYDGTWTIERAAADLATFAASRKTRAALGIDSIQTVRCAADEGYLAAREAVTARAMAIRAVATQHRLITVSTSEMMRAAYKSIQAAEDANDMAAAKESGAIEYSARVMLALRSVKDEEDLLELNIAKNKHGPRDVRIGLRIDRARQRLDEERLPEVDEGAAAAAAEEAKKERARAQCRAAAVALVGVLLKQPGLATRDLEGALRATWGPCGRPLATGALHALGEGVARIDGARRAQLLYLVGAKLPPEVVSELPVEIKAAAVSAVVPKDALLGGLPT